MYSVFRKKVHPTQILIFKQPKINFLLLAERFNYYRLSNNNFALVKLETENNKNRGVWENRGYIFYSNVKKFYLALST